MPRALLYFLLSVLVHVGVVLGMVGARLWLDRAALPPIALRSIEIEVKDFPLGPPKDPAATPGAPAPRPKPRAKPRVAKQGLLVSGDAGIQDPVRDAGPPPSSHDAGAADDAGKRKPGDLRRYGPEGSTLIALLRLDRLRDAPHADGYIQAIDQLLKLLPDRRNLIDGTGFDLYRDFGTLLIATPNPRDVTVTFLAARHTLAEKNLRAGLERGAASVGRVLEWRTVGGRPVGIRKRPDSQPGTETPWDRDDRIFVLPQPTLAIMATPAHAKLLLGRDIPTDTVDGGVKDQTLEKPLRRPTEKDHWKSLIERIDGEDSAMPGNAVFMMVANNLFQAPAQALPGTTGSADDLPIPISSFPIPTVLSLVAEIDPSPVLDLTAQFSREEEAIRWERDLPTWRARAAVNPLVILSGFAGLIARVEATREENQITLHIAPTAQELQRALNMAANLTRTAQRSRAAE